MVLTVPGMPVIYYGEEFGKQRQTGQVPGHRALRPRRVHPRADELVSLAELPGDKKTPWNIDFVKTDAKNAALMLGAGMCKAANPDYPFILFMGADDTNSWAAQKDDAGSLFSYYKQLVTIRKANPILTDLSADHAMVQNTASLYEFQVSSGMQSLSVVLIARRASRR